MEFFLKRGGGGRMYYTIDVFAIYTQLFINFGTVIDRDS